MEKKLDNLTDKLLGALKTGTQTPEEEQEKSDLGRKVVFLLNLIHNLSYPR